MDNQISQAQLAGILDIADDAIISIDERQRIILFNKGAERIFGFSAEEAIGQPLEMLLPGVARPAHAAHVDDFRRSPTPSRRMAERSEIAGRRKDGTEFPAEASISRLGSGQNVIYTAILRDVTQQKRQSEMLRAAKQAAEVAVQAKSMFLANMSHEIRTPLNAIIGMTSLLLHTELADEQRDFVETIRSSGDALLTVINEILDFTKIELGNLELDIHPFDVRRAIEASLDLVAGTAAEKNINLAYLVEDSVPPVVVSDGTRLRQVLLNILSNAVKFTRRGEVVVNVEAAPSGPSAFELHFSVSDTGIGISAEELGKLFKPFSQVDASTTREYGGTGLGLVISKRLCEIMGGRIWVESAPGHGSTFHFTILATRGEALPQPYLDDQPALAGKRVLIVDDNTTNRRVLVKHALKWGMLPQAVASPQEALDLVRHGHALDIAILDMSMPHMDGVQLARAIRQTRDEKSLPLVLLSSMGQRQRSGTPEEALFAAHLHKPIKLSQLFDTLMSLVGGIAAQGAPAAAGVPRLAEALPLKILVAEDNVVNQKVVLRMLAHLGYIADVAANGHEVLAALERQDYDVVLMDIQMPDMDGLEATRRIIERHPRERRPRIIAMTANALRGDRERFLAAGMDGYLSKPIDINGLSVALQHVPEAKKAASRGVHSVRPTLDQAQLDNLREVSGENGTLLAEVTDHFIADIPAGVASLEAFAANGDSAGLGQAAHRMASTALACGAVRVAEACRELEQAAANGGMWLAPGLIRRLHEEFDQARTALLEWRERGHQDSSRA
ncbi:MAG TPA: response regulator [Usitatibacter sp.]|nr:response regulator [Usitatibacter sp.]